MVPSQDKPIAIIGMSGIFPGSSTVRQFFENVLRKRCFVRDLPDWLWDQELYYSPDPAEPLKSYSHIGALLGDLEIDLSPFRIPPTVAAQMSLNQQLALLCTRQALLDAGYPEGSFDRERVGVIMAAVTGEGIESRMEALLARRLRARLATLAGEAGQRRLLKKLWQAYDASYPAPPITEDTLPGELGSLVAGRIASAFDLHGMNLTVDSACASSLAAVAMGMMTLSTGACDLVIAGGVDTDMSAGAYVTFSKVNALSANGSYPFDERSDGFVMGEGCGVLILKRYTEAVRDGDRIYALLHGYGSSSDGAGKGITAPSSDGQLRAMRRAYEVSGISPAELDFLECHATGTQVGDAEELLSVARLVADPALGPPRLAPLSIGTAKAMVGHLKIAAGVAGLFRAILGINSRVVPPQVNFEQPNSRLDWESSRLRVAIHPEPLPHRPITAGVSSFGFGGTNFHVVLGTAPKNARPPVVRPEEFLLPELPPLESDVALLFPGQGSQYVGMLAALREDPQAEALLARAERIVREVSGAGLLEAIYPPDLDPGNESALEAGEALLRATAIAQPAIFTLSAILYERVRKLGVQPGMCIGHSLGEYTALYATGTLGFDDAVRAVAMRGHLMENLAAQETGTMAVLSAGLQQAQGLLAQVEGYLTCANLNSYDQTVVAGEAAAVNALVARALAGGVPARLLNVDRAFHSRYLQPCAAPMAQVLEAIPLYAAHIPVPANVSRQIYPLAAERESAGRPLGASERHRLIDLLTQQITHPVDFISQIELAYEAGARRFVEVGPRRVLTRLVEGMLQGKPFQAFSLDAPGCDLDQALEGLRQELARPLGIPRQPLPTGPRQVHWQAPEPGDTPALASPAELVRSVVAQVSGYELARIGDEAEFERDLGIDTLKILQIVARLRGKVLPQDFTDFRRATSVRKILNFSASAGEAVRAADDERVRCFDCVTVAAGLPAGQPSAGRRYRLIIGPGPEGWEKALPDWGEITDPGSSSTVLVFPQPASAAALCRETLPQLLTRLIELAEATADGQAESELHLVSLEASGGFSSAMFRALSAFTKSCQKDLPYLQLSYTHVDGPAPEAERMRRLLASPLLGRRVRADGKFEQGTLVPRPTPAGDDQRLAALLGPRDLVLVTGGARGIAASAVRQLLPRVRARFLLLGRKAQVEDWIASEGHGRVEYVAADLADERAVRALQLGERGITLVIHAAGTVISRPIREIRRAELDQVLGGKVLGLERILEQLDASRLRGVVNFSSAAGYFGGDGHPDYAAANAYLDGFARPGLPVLSIGWSAWAEVGMAARSEAKEFLELAGVEPIPLQEGVQVFTALLADFLSQAAPGTRNTLVLAGMAGSTFLPRDPFRQAMVAGAGGQAPFPVEAFRLTDLSASLPEAFRASPAAAELQQAILPLGEELSLGGTGVIALRLPAAARFGATLLGGYFTPAEKLEMKQVKARKRRLEKTAGKLAAKLLASEALRRWYGLDRDLSTFQVVVFERGVRVEAPGEPALAQTLDSLYFSISHSDNVVCAAVSRGPVGIDVEHLRPLPYEAVAEILGGLKGEAGLQAGDPNALAVSGTVPPADWAPVAVFTQKEAILKASGVGMAKGLGEVELKEIALGIPVEAAHRGTRYRVVSLLADGNAFSLACTDAPAHQAARPQPVDKLVPASYGQEGLWFLEKMEGIGATHCVAWTERLRGELDLPALTRSLQFVADRHESLRTVLRELDGRCQAEVLASIAAEPALVDLSQHQSASVECEIEQRIQEEMRAGFDLSHGPLMRAVLFRLAPFEHVLLMIFHHAVIDATSAYTLRRELAACYEAFIDGHPPSLLPLPCQYGEYARRQRETLTGERLEKHAAFWRDSLAGQAGFLDLATDRARPAIQTYRAHSVALPLPAELQQQVDRLSQSLGVTPFVTYLAALQVLLMRLSDQDQVVVGTPFVGRDPDLFPLVGYFVNTLPVPADLSGDPEFRAILPAVRTAVLKALEHQELPLPKLVELLAPHRDPAYPPLFQILMRLMGKAQEDVRFKGLESEFTELPNPELAYDLSVVIGLSRNCRQVQFDYNRDLFAADTVRHMADQYLRLLEAVVTRPELRLWEIPLLAEGERDQVVRAWNETRRSIPERTVHDLFAEAAGCTPRAVALEWDGGRMTYRQLNERANQLAHHLLGLGVKPEEAVGLAMDRSPDTFVALLGILKAGGAYLPLDPDDPPERLRHKLAEAQVRFLLTQEGPSKKLPADGGKLIHPGRLWGILSKESRADPEVEVGPDRLAYIMYTSGTTGQQKGVEVTHRSIVRLVFEVEYARLDPAQRILCLAPLAFDASTFEIWGALLHGARCVLHPETVPSVARLGRVLRQHAVTTLFLTTSLFNTLIDERPEILRGVKQLLTGGEAHSLAHVRRALELLPETQLTSVYGPTEATTFTCFYPVPRTVDENWRSIPIGRPIGNTTAYVLDRAGRPAPVGVPGELHIGGLGLARGYLKRPDLTAAAFLPDPFQPEGRSRLYKTGDIVRWLPGGNLEFIGRKDRQVKIRGHRIELEELEAVLAAHPGVGEAAVVLEDGGPGGKRLIAHLTARRGQTLHGQEVQAFLRQKLPAYMLPARIEVTAELPKTASGKVARQALVSRRSGEAQPGRTPPGDEVERRLAAIWEQVLGAGPVGVEDDFFELGGHSLLAVRLFAALERQTGIQLPVATILQYPTVADLASLLRRKGWSPAWSSLVPIQPAGGKAPLFCVHWAGGNVLIYRDLARHLAPDRPVYGLQALGLDRRQAPHIRIEDMAAFYIEEIRAFQPKGPYHLVGASMGGVIVFEMAQQLHAMGAQVGLAGLFDTFGEYESRPLPLAKRVRLHAYNLQQRSLGGRLTYPLERLLARTRHELTRAIVRAGLPLPKILWDLKEISFLAALNYQPRPYPGKVTLFRAKQRTLGMAGSLFLGWEKYAAGGLEVHEVSGDHVTLMKEPQVGALAAILRQCLEQEEAGQRRE